MQGFLVKMQQTTNVQQQERTKRVAERRDGGCAHALVPVHYAVDFDVGRRKWGRLERGKPRRTAGGAQGPNTNTLDSP